MHGGGDHDGGGGAVGDPTRRLSLVRVLAALDSDFQETHESNMLECRQEVAFDVARHAT
jgi:hypothetical protein